MKKLSVLLFSMVSVLVYSVRSQTAEVLLRPAYVDLSSSDAPGAVLVHLSGYSSDDVRYRLYNGSTSIIAGTLKPEVLYRQMPIHRVLLSLEHQ